MILLIVLRGDPGLYWFLLVTGLIVGSWLYKYYNSRKYRVSNTMEEQDFTDLSKVKSGEFVKIKGEVWAGGEKIKSPLSGRSCVYYHVHIERKTGGKNRSWVTEVEEEMMADVVLKCGNYYAIIQADSPLSHLIADRQYSSGFLDDALPQLEAFLKKSGSSSTNWIGMNHSMRYKEGILEHKERFAVAGTAKWISSSELAFHLPVENVLLISEVEGKGVFISDDPLLLKRN